MKKLPSFLEIAYKNFEEIIIQRLNEFKNISTELFFYEFCFCILTPQSSAKNAIEVQNKLTDLDFFNKKFAPNYLLADRNHYIRFHNVKSQRLLSAIDFYPNLLEILFSGLNQHEKRKRIKDNFSGLGMKESSHFLRNIGYKNLAIIDRHILKNLYLCGVLEDISPPKNERQYLEIESKFLDYANEIGIEMDFLDLLFFANSTGMVLK